MLSLEESVQELINDGKGDIGRLEHILSTLKKGNILYTSDKEYLERLLAESRKSNDTIQSNEPKVTKSYSEYTSESEPKDTTMQHAEIELIRKEIHKLQDKNHLIEEQLRNQDSLKSGSWLRAFGRGIAGISLFLFGLAMMFVLYSLLTNLDSLMRGMYYGGEPMAVFITVTVIIPAILLSIGGSSIYYGIRIISKT